MWPELSVLLRDVQAADPGALSVELGDDAWSIVATRPAPDATLPLAIAVQVEPDHVRVILEGWTQRFAAADVDEDDRPLGLDLVAAALFGRLRVRVERRHGRVVGRQFVFATSRGPVVHRNERTWRWPWVRTHHDVLANAIAPPPQHPLGEGGALPWAPWAGTLAAGTTAASPGMLAIDGELDLHPFSPRDVKPLVLEYLEVCKQRGITEVRIVHGKGIGALRRTVHAILAKHPDVLRYRLGGMREGSWGATIVNLRPASQADP